MLEDFAEIFIVLQISDWKLAIKMQRVWDRLDIFYFLCVCKYDEKSKILTLSRNMNSSIRCGKKSYVKLIWNFSKTHYSTNVPCSSQEFVLYHFSCVCMNMLIYFIYLNYFFDGIETKYKFFNITHKRDELFLFNVRYKNSHLELMSLWNI